MKCVDCKWFMHGYEVTEEIQRNCKAGSEVKECYLFEKANRIKVKEF